MFDRTKQDHFCVYPFVQVVSRTTGGLGPCCMISTLSNLRETQLPVFWQHSSMTDMRSQMLRNDAPIPQCTVCKSQEASVGSSMRTEALRDYGFIAPRHYKQHLHDRGWFDPPSPKRLEIHVGNTCNLKCLTCNPKDSSMFLDEDIRLNISHYDRQEFSYTPDQINEIFDWISGNELDLLDLRGGESMLSPVIKKRLQHLPSHIYDRAVLRIQTNGTIYDEIWKEIFEKFSMVEIMISIDGYHTVNEYVRFPSDWHTLEKNIDLFRAHRPQQFFINTVVSNLNLPSLGRLLQWSYDKDIYCHLSPLTQPKIYQFQNLPKAVFDNAIDDLRNWDHHPKVQGIVGKQSLQDSELWHDFCRMIALRDQHRGNSIFDIYPEFRDVWDM